MICKKCGSSISDTSKFCGNCGEEVKKINAFEPTSDLNEEKSNINIQNNNSFDYLNVSDSQNEVSQVNEPDSLVMGQELQEQSKDKILINNENVVELPTDRPLTLSNNINKGKNNTKSNNKLIVAILIAVLVIGTAFLIFLAMNNSSKSSIIVLEKALGNFDRNAKNSGTINTNISIKSKTSDSLNLAATIMYSKNNDFYDFMFRLNKSILNDEINLYSRIDEKNAILYINSKVVDMLGFTESNLNTWLKYSVDLTKISLEKSENSDIINIKNIIDNEHFKFINKTNGIRKYKLVIDKALLEKIKNNFNVENKEELDSIADAIEEIGDNAYELEFYFNDAEELVKVEMDLTKMIDDNDIENASISFSFLNLNSTTVSIPYDALNSNLDLETYMSNYSALDTSLNDDMNSFNEFDINTGI